MGAEPSVEYVVDIHESEPRAYSFSRMFPNQRVELDAETIQDLKAVAYVQGSSAEELIREALRDRYRSKFT